MNLMRAKIAWLCAITSLILPTTHCVYALPASFTNSVIINDSDFTDLPNYFAGRDRDSSIALIQKFLEVSGSALAKPENNKSNHPNDIGKDFSKIFLDVPTDWGTPDGQWLKDRPWLKPYTGRTVSTAEAIWMISQEDLGKSRYINTNQFYTTNPVYLLALIQKESGLSYGTYSTQPYGNQSLNFRYNRMTGYACFEGKDDCEDWALGAFRQMYLGIRDKKAYSDGCRAGFNVWNNGALGNSSPFNQGFKVGNSVTIDGHSIYLGTAIACASYLYTPHDTYYNFFNIIKSIDQKMAEIAPTVTTSNPPPSTSASSSSSIIPPTNPIPDSFTGVQNQQQAAVKEAIKQVDAPKPPPAPVYVPLYTESPIEQTADTHPIDFMQAAMSGRSISNASLASVLGAQDVRNPWYAHPVTVITGTYLILQSLLLAVYWLFRQRK